MKSQYCICIFYYADLFVKDYKNTTNTLYLSEQVSRFFPPRLIIPDSRARRRDKADGKTWFRIPQHISKRKLKVRRSFLQVHRLPILPIYFSLLKNCFFWERKAASIFKFLIRHKMDLTIV